MRWGGGIDYQDTPQVHPCRLILGFLPRKVMFRMNGMPRAHGCAGAASFKLA